MGGSVSSFSLNKIQNLDGKVAVVTGGNVGIGFGIVKGFVSKGATVIVASRNATRVNEAVAEVKKLYSNAKVEGMVLDVSSFSSIDAFVAELSKYLIAFRTSFNLIDVLLFSKHPKIDILVNNAGIMMVPHVKTEQGFEVTLGSFPHSVRPT